MAGVPASEISATFAPRSIALTSWRARSTRSASWLETNCGRGDVEQLEEAARAAGVLAGDDVGLGQRSRTRAVMSSILPIGVGQTVSRPGISRLALRFLERHRRGADHACFRPQLGCGDARLVHRWQRARAISSRAGPSSSSPAAITPPPITITSGSNTFA